MTYEEAMKILHPNTTLTALTEVEYYGGFNGQEAKIKAVEEACLLACEALEKQTPKKPLHMHKNYYCPICKEDGWMLWDDAIPNDMDEYCGKCGQAIDWSDDE